MQRPKIKDQTHIQHAAAVLALEVVRLAGGSGAARSGLVRPVVAILQHSNIFDFRANNSAEIENCDFFWITAQFSTQTRLLKIMNKSPDDSNGIRETHLFNLEKNQNVDFFALRFLFRKLIGGNSKFK